MEVVNIFSASDSESVNSLNDPRLIKALIVMATASRTIWAFSRENGLPFSHILVKVYFKQPPSFFLS